jgi:uncharacterized membrane protein YsdA (DUF1294 family)
MTTAQTIIAIFVLLNLMTFCVYWWDKEAARDGDWRVSEATLIQLAFLGGSIGAVAAQQLLRHKTRKEPFRSRLRLIVILHILVLGGCLALRAT